MKNFATDFVFRRHVSRDGIMLNLGGILLPFAPKNEIIILVRWSPRTKIPIMMLSPMGKIVAKEIALLKTRRPYVLIDTYAIMPNHVHFLLQLRTPKNEQPKPGRALRANSLGVIVGQWKAGVTRSIMMSECGKFAWQDRYHEKIIRYAIGLEEIREYIRNNPREWLRDRNHSSGVYM